MPKKKTFKEFCREGLANRPNAKVLQRDDDGNPVVIVGPATDFDRGQFEGMKLLQSHHEPALKRLEQIEAICCAPQAQTPTPATRPPLSPKREKPVYEIIKKHGPITGPRIIAELDRLSENDPDINALDLNTLYKEILGRTRLLRTDYGVNRRKRVGYYIEK